MYSEISESPGDERRWASIDSKVKEYRLGELFDLLNKRAIDAIALKGWSAGRFYPVDEPRAYTDIDVAIPPDEIGLVEELDRIVPPGTNVDIHLGLRTLETSHWSEIFSRSYLVELNGIFVRVLSDEDNLRLTAVHWLTDGGIYREKLWDVYHMVNNRKPEFDWDGCLDMNGDVRRSWVIAAIATARDYLDLEVDALPEVVRNARLPDWYRRTLEKEWRLGGYPRIPLRICIRSPKVFLEQIRRRVPPNKIAATIEMEQPIDDRGRAMTQIRSARKRAVEFIRQAMSAGD